MSEVTRLRQFLSEANSAAEYAEGFLGGTMTPAIHEALERHLEDAPDRYYRLGQLLAMPSLLDADRPALSTTNASSSGKADGQARKAIASP